MALNMSALQQPLHQVTPPDPTKRYKTLADAQTYMQDSEIRNLKIQEAQAQASDRQTGKARQDQEWAFVQESINKNAGDIEKALPDILANVKDPEILKVYQGIAQSREASRGAEATRQGAAAARTEAARHNQALEEDARLRREAEANKPVMVPPNTGVLKPGEVTPGYTQPPAPNAINSPFELWQRDNPKGTIAQWNATNPDPARVDPPINISTVDDNNNPITRVLPRSQAVGKDFPQAPTAEERNRTAATKKIDPILDGISELSEKINTGKGLLAKVSGSVEKAQAQANYNDDVAEYQALISGFTPMIARGVGHTGVLTQQDVDSVKEMFPKPGDSKSLRDRKIARLRTIIGTSNDQGNASAGREQFSKSTGQYRHTLDGGKTWLNGRLPK